MGEAVHGYVQLSMSERAPAQVQFKLDSKTKAVEQSANVLATLCTEPYCPQKGKKCVQFWPF